MKDLGKIDGKPVILNEFTATVTRGKRTMALNDGNLYGYGTLDELIERFPKKASRWVRMYRRALKTGGVAIPWENKWPFLKKVKLIKGGVPLGEVSLGVYAGWKDNELYVCDTNAANRWVAVTELIGGVPACEFVEMIKRALSLNLPIETVQVPRIKGIPVIDENDVEVHWVSPGRLVWFSTEDDGFVTADNWDKGTIIGKSAALCRKAGLPVDRIRGGSTNEYSYDLD